ncbi:hypothetical protein [Streptomyces sp. NPDC056061]|uniref:hypothetical protein n=1 Tax=Streptomyces sp. NPDC056061 TaxID=3345700 RepID=UPI0035DE36EA
MTEALPGVLADFVAHRRHRELAAEVDATAAMRVSTPVGDRHDAPPNALSAEQEAIERDHPATALIHGYGNSPARRLACGHRLHEVCQRCDRCPHTCCYVSLKVVP